MDFFKKTIYRKFLLGLIGLAAVTVFVSGAIYFRLVVVSDRFETTFFEVFVWQAASWLVWVLFVSAFALPGASKIQRFIRGWNLPAHLLSAVAVAAASTLWFKFVSENLSPFLTLEDTRYGVFPWFFIFWFFIGVILYWGSVNFFGLSGTPAKSETDKTKPRLVVKTGKVSEVIKPENVLWIEAQDYYSVLHLAEKQSWIKMTMKELEDTLDPAVFVRVHRSTIINVNHLDKIKTEAPGKYSAVMKGGKSRPISRAGWRDLKKILKTTK